MGIAIDTVLSSAVNPGAGPAAFTVAPSGDSLQVRPFNTARNAYLENIIRAAGTAGFSRVRSAMLHDNTFGIQITPQESPSVYSIPAEADQMLRSGDNLVIEGSGGAAETDLTLLSIYYEDLPGITGRFHTAAEVAGNTKFIKPHRVACVSSAVIGAWTDTPLATTENLLHTGSDYAVLGYMSNAALAAIGIKGAETGNLRVCGPGSTSELVTTDFFLEMNRRNGRPWVPVFNAQSIGNLSVSVAANTASVAATVTLILAELTNPLSN